MSCVPQEILDLIIDCLHDDTAALKSCSLAHRSFLFSTRIYLFREFTAYSAKNASSAAKLHTDARTLANFAQFLVESRNICDYIQSLTVYGRTQDAPTPFFVRTHALVSILARLPRLRELCLHSVCLLAANFEEELKVIRSHQHAFSIRGIKLSQSAFRSGPEDKSLYGSPFSDLLSTFSRVDTLSLDIHGAISSLFHSNLTDELGQLPSRTSVTAIVATAFPLAVRGEVNPYLSQTIDLSGVRTLHTKLVHPVYNYNIKETSIFLQYPSLSLAELHLDMTKFHFVDTFYQEMLLSHLTPPTIPCTSLESLTLSAEISRISQPLAWEVLTTFLSRFLQSPLTSLTYLNLRIHIAVSTAPGISLLLAKDLQMDPLRQALEFSKRLRKLDIVFVEEEVSSAGIVPDTWKEWIKKIETHFQEGLAELCDRGLVTVRVA
ncbi:unnamed protein product [Somion occarium]|uniref:F-box domain-containing protein n=1 Tax=Somion occarium TaxID=3059160 RepID=A0ABP1E7V9_9APHY